jgi:hypothetical protein
MREKTNMNGRATSVEELDVVVGNFFDESKKLAGLAFKPRPSDVIISPYAKCGTTWLQQIAHGLRTRGSMDFDEINCVSPWIEVAYDVGWDLEESQVANPRLYKSHVSWHDIPKGCRYICSFRHPYDAIRSFYRFFEGWLFEPRTISMETLTHWRWPRDEVETQGYWYHLISWWEQRNNKDVLLLCYEDMKADLPGTVQKIAGFMGIELDDCLLDIVVRQSSREFMLAHRHQFDEHHMHKIGAKRAGLPPAIDSSKVTPGTSNRARHQLSPALKEMLDDIWREQVQSRFGFKDYEELRQALIGLESPVFVAK